MKQGKYITRLLVPMAVIIGVVFLWRQHHAPRHARGKSRRFAQVHHLANGGYCYHDGQGWWYYDITFSDSGGTYSPKANTWTQSAKSPADCNLRVDSAKDTSNPEEVEVTPQGEPEQEIMTEAEATELGNQVNDMVSEGNPNSPDMSEADAGSTDSGSDGGGGDSGGGDSGGGDGGD